MGHPVDSMDTVWKVSFFLWRHSADINMEII